jgi:outer membrane lipoprotein-sorting protein
MTIRRITASFSLAAAIFVTSASAFAQPKPGHLDEVLRQMDAASAKFRSAEADFQWDLFEQVVKQTTSQKGTIYFEKEGAKAQMGAKIVDPSIKLLEYREGTLRIFEPGTDHLTTILARKNQAQMDSFLTLGFGGSGKDLERAWTVSDLGMESMSDGSHAVETAKLDLVSKDPSVRNLFTHITVWVDTERGISLKQVFYMPSEDRRTVVNTNIRYNQKVDQRPYEIKTDGKTTKDEH